MEDLNEKLRRLDGALRSANDAIVRYSRTLVPTLKDVGREHSAKELERLVFEYDVAVEEAANLVRDNMDGILEMLKRGPK